MRAVIQRVTSASVTGNKSVCTFLYTVNLPNLFLVDGKVISQIGQGLCVLIGISRDDTEADSDWM